MVVPQLAGGVGGVADLLVDQLGVPRFADAEGVHAAHLHVGDHLRWRHDDGVDIGVRVDAAGRQPVAHPQVMGAAGEGHRRTDFLAAGLLRFQCGLERCAVEADLQVAIFLADRNALTGQVQPREDRHGYRLVVRRDDAGADQVGHRREDVCAIDAVLRRAEHQVVAGGAPGRLLEYLDLGHPVFGEEALLGGDEQRRGVGQGDKAELGLAGLHITTCSPGGRTHAQGHAAEQGDAAGGNDRVLEKAAARGQRYAAGLVVVRLVGHGRVFLWAKKNGATPPGWSRRAWTPLS